MDLSMRPRTLWLNILPALDAILNAKTLTEAADKANLTQPALSIALKRARSHFNDELVIYRGAHTTLTELGAALRPRVKAALVTAREALDLELDFDPKSAVRTVRIMCNSYIEYAFVPRLLARLYSSSPGLSVEIAPFRPLPQDPNTLEDIDIILAAKSLASPSYSCAHLLSDRLTCMVWREHSTLGESVTTEQWLELRHATAAAPIHGSAPSLLRALNEAQRYGLRAHSATTMPHMIVGTDLVITSMTSYCEPFTHYLPLRLVPIAKHSQYESELNIDVSVFWKPHRDIEPFIKWLVDECQEVAGTFRSGMEGGK
jgi:LysR family transcriptional regulator, nod-box dependent transcriptional activator